MALRRAQLIAKQLRTVTTSATNKMASVSTVPYALNHTMFRIKDPKVSLDFYKKHFGMDLVATLPVNELGFTNYFLAFNGAKALYKDKPWYEREGVLELCHNHGSENDSSFKANNGNVEPHRGFGHICFSVDRLEPLCESLEAAGVKFQKKLSDGRQKDIAFALDPDGYWIELVANKTIAEADKLPAGDLSRIRFYHTMIRVKDPVKSLKFYEETLGMVLLRTNEVPNAKFNLYFLGYNKDPNFVRNSGEGISDREGVLELTWNYGTESDPDFKYHTGNEQPQGFGHIGITVPDVDEAMAKLEAKGATIKKRRTDGKMKFIGFVADPDGYAVEILPRADFPEKIVE
ncbi:lactoylglutathione lyase GLO1 [Sugiyamaella lignohabitans]|uniref:Lactoylglutathione lyase n=1 Tax=Sugiyamaella lignohabitans TaxID=796027 RepID=A0A167F823_9ASCO|nr:lactoylglutathione lyase GLO1 [Sugiyamaella lignohabitans]ANB14935.1 lactoylglutathione lyase GLO1 [Sugiyamaella lignohabitans]